MKKSQFLIILIAISLFSFLGGFLSNTSYQIFFSQRKNSHLNKTIEAYEFKLIDKFGNHVASFMAGEPLIKADGFEEIDLSPNREEPALFFYKENGKPSISINKDGIRIHGNNKSALLLSSDFISLASSKSRMVLRSNNFNNGAQIELLDQNNVQRAVLGAVSLEVIKTGEKKIRPESSIVLFDKDGKVIYSAP